MTTSLNSNNNDNNATSNASTIASLPIEIIDQILEFLNEYDTIECLCVSPTWNTLFRRGLYKSVKINSQPTFSRFFSTLQQSARRYKKRRVTTSASNTSIPGIPRDLGHNVRHIQLCDGLMTVRIMDRLADHCPNVTSITYRWLPIIDKNSKETILQRTSALSSSATPKIIKKKYGSKTRTFHNPVPFFQHFHPAGLKSSTLIANGNNTDDDPFWQSLDITSQLFPVLQHFSKLEELVLYLNKLRVTITDMEEIHSTCPNLKKLDINLADLQSPSSSTSGSSSDDDAPLLLDQVQPARTVQHLSLRSTIWSNVRICSNPWFNYIQRKYPELQTLNLASDDEFREEEFYITEEIVFRERNPVAGTIILKNQFPRLEHLEIGRFAGKPSTSWTRLMNGIPSIALHDDETEKFDEWIKATTTTTETTTPTIATTRSTTNSNSLQSLKLACIPQSIGGLVYCSHLRELFLDGRSFKLSPRRPELFQELPLNTILSCPALEKLTIIRFILDYTGSSNSNSDDPAATGSSSSTAPKTPISPLKSMIVHESAITDKNVLTQVGQRCPYLLYLDITYCTWNSFGKHPVIQINMPRQKFKYFRLLMPGIWRRYVGSSGTGGAAFRGQQKPWKSVYLVPGLPDYLLLKKHNGTITTATTAQAAEQRLQEESNNGQESITRVLFKTQSLQSQRLLVKRVNDSADIMSWLENHGKTKQKAEEVFTSHCGNIQYRSVVLSLQSVDNLYYNGTRLNDDDENFTCTTNDSFAFLESLVNV